MPPGRAAGKPEGRMKLSIVVPCYNEAANLPTLVRRFREAIGGRADVEAVLVNNGSTDHSADVFDEQLADPANRFARVVWVPVNKGYGYGILAGLRAARGDVLGWTHADLQTDPADVLAAFDLLARQADPANTFVRGRRVGRPLFDAAFTAGMSAVATLALGTRLHDVNAQPKLFHRSFLARMTAAPDDFALDLYALYVARTAGLNVLEVPVRFGKRTAGEAKGGGSLRGKYKLTKRTFNYILALRRGLKAAPPPIELRRAA